MSVSPLHYALVLHPLLSERTFSGSVSIDVLRAEPVDRIILDSVGLEITAVTLDGKPAAFEVDESHLTIADDRTSGRARIAITFRGAMRSDGRGLSVTEGLAVTQLQPSYARMVFPCFDEPRHKATYDVTISAAPDHAVVSNAAIAREEIVGDRRVVTFARTPPMPAFLLAIAIGPFAITNADSDGTPVRFLTRAADGRESFALDVAVRCLRFYSHWLGVPYPFAKLDLVAVPQYEVAAMENSGGIVFRESAVLVDSATATATARRQVAELVAHEVAHQWFGSLVTPASWNELWLSEGFATWLAPKGVAAVSEELAAELDPTHGRRVAMAADSLRSSRAMSAAASADARELFDPIAYQKGAAILRMLEAWLGEAVFQTRVHEYLARHAGGVVTAEDLWRALGDEAEAIAASFVSMAGVPRLTFDWKGDVIRITQSEPIRTIPVAMRVGLEGGGTVIHRQLLRESVTEVRMPSPVVWLYGNADAAGYYRSSHSPLHEIPTHALTPRETAARLDDLWDAVWNGETDILAFLRAAAEAGAFVRSHLVEIRELLAGGARGLVFDRWIVAQFGSALPAEAAPDVDDHEARLMDPSTRAAAWSHLKAHWDELRTHAITFGGRGVITALGVVADPSMRDDIAAFFSGRNIAGGERALRQTLEQIDSRIWFRERQQRMFDAWLARQSAPLAAASDRLRFAHGFLNALTSGVYGALAGRMALDRLGVPASAGMLTANELRAAHGLLDPLFLQLFLGRPSIDERLLDLGRCLREDLLTAATHTEGARAQLLSDDGADAMKITAAQVLRNAAVREQFFGGVVAISDLFGPAGEANRWRSQWPTATAAAADARGLLMRVLAAENTPLLRDTLFERSALLPGTLRSFAVDLAAIDAWLRGDATFDHQAESWRAFGFTPEEAAQWKAAGVAQPAEAAARQLAIERHELC